MSRLAQEVDVEVSWRPFLLRPNIPEEGVEKPPATPGHRFPGDNGRVNPRLKSAGLNVGIDFTGLTDRYPNTVAAHALLEYALVEHGPKVQNDLAEILFRHYFTDGLYPDQTNLRAAAVEARIDADAALKFAFRSDIQQQVRHEALNASRGGIGGVPFFYVNGKPAFSGAQPVDSFEELLRDEARA